MWHSLKYSFITCIISAGTACYLLFTTTTGLSYDLQWLAKQLPGKFTIEAVSGNLASGFTLYGLSYKDTEFQFQAASLSIQWQPIALLRGNVVIQKMELVKGHWMRLKTSDRSIRFNVETILRHCYLEDFIIKDLNIENGANTLTLDGELTDKWEVRWKLKAPELSNHQGSLQSEGTILGERFEPLLESSFTAKQLTWDNKKINKLDGKIRLSLKPHDNSSLTLTAFDSTIDTAFFKKITLGATTHFSIEQHAMIGQLNVTLQNKPFISADFSLPLQQKLFQPDQPINAIIKLEPLAANNLIWPHPIKATKGIITGNLTLSGNLANPLLQGSLNLNHGTLVLPQLGTVLEDIIITATLHRQKPIELHGNFLAGSGKGTIDGEFDPREKTFPLTLMVKGDHLLVVDLPEYHLSLSPDAVIHFSYPNLAIQGSVNVDSASIKPKKLKDTMTLPDEVVILSEEHPKETLAFNSNIAIDLTLSDHVYVNYDDLEATFAGKIHLTKNNDGPVIAHGELHTTQGNYTAYRQKLTLEKGRFIYAGNTLLNPGLDIKAIKYVRRIVTDHPGDFAGANLNVPIYGGAESLKIGMQINGTAERPIFTLFSTPSAMSQQDILSYLILGQPQTHLSGTQGVALISLLASLNPNGSTWMGYTEKLQQKLGLTELSIESVESFNPFTNAVQSTTSFVIGKQLTKKLSLHYSIGLLEPISVLNVRYDINKHWMIRSETSTVDNGADLMYVIERD